MSATFPDSVITPDGLDSATAHQLLLQHGPNRLPVPRPPSPWRQLAGQMFHFFALLLWVAAVLAILAGMPQLGVAIVIVVIVNGLFSFFQEFRAERAAEKLRDLLPRKALVLRDGAPIEIDASGLVPGDLVILSAGDRISADLRLTEVHGLLIDTSTLTGESVPIAVEADDGVFAGTFVVSGEARGLVEATGGGTRLAGIARLTQTGPRTPSPLTSELNRVVRITAFVAVSVGIAFLGIALLVGIPPRDGFLFAIGVMVALVPEGLLPTITLSLASGAQRMAGRQALVRKLESVETLGSTTYICTDKTGTLTRNEMAVVEVWTPTGSAIIQGVGYEPTGQVHADPSMLPDLQALAVAAVRCSAGQIRLRDGAWTAQGDPMEAAIDAFARRLTLDTGALERDEPITRRFPFDSQRRRASVVAGDSLFLKGAPDAVLPLCQTAGIAEATVSVDALTSRGLRVIAVARAVYQPDQVTADEAERNLDLLGLVALEDPPRPEVREALDRCRDAGIRVAMITGDHPATARAIATEVGLWTDESLLLEGKDLPPDEASLGELIDRPGTIISRVTPEDKLRIALALRGRGHVVAMTGDGVNDGPALHAANIGVAMGRGGTDVAREAADLVLLDDNFGTIVAAIEQGRATFANIRRFLTYHLTDNVAELTPFVVWALTGGMFPLAIGVLQVLCLDIGTDLLPALALGAEPPRKGVMQEPPTRLHLLDRSLLFRVFLVLGPIEAVLEMAAFIAVLQLGGWHPGDSMVDPGLIAAASGAAFATVVLSQLGNALACRSTTVWPGRLGWTTNPLLLVALGAELVMLALFLFVAPIASLLGQSPPPLIGWVFALLSPVAVLLGDAAHKAWLRRRPVALLR